MPSFTDKIIFRKFKYAPICGIIQPSRSNLWSCFKRAAANIRCWRYTNSGDVTEVQDWDINYDNLTCLTDISTCFKYHLVLLVSRPSVPAVVWGTQLDSRGISCGHCSDQADSISNVVRSSQSPVFAAKDLIITWKTCVNLSWGNLERLVGNPLRWILVQPIDTCLLSAISPCHQRLHFVSTSPD